MDEEEHVRLADALRKAQAWMDEVEGVQGVAQGKLGQQDCITVFVSSPQAADQIPGMVNGYKVVVEHTDPFRAL